MSVVNLEFYGLFGALIFFATVVLLVVVTGALSFSSFRKKETNRSKYFFLSGIIFLLLDGIFFVLTFLRGDNTITKGEGTAFDQRMLYIWIPFHLIGYFLVAVMLRFVRLRKEKINKFIDKLR
jgi:hypothetical protein